MAEPIWLEGTEFCTERTNTCIISPRPMPVTTMFRAASAFVVFTSMVQSRSRPIPSTIGPTSAFGL